MDAVLPEAIAEG